MRRMTFALLLILAVASVAGCERYKLDRQMAELCKKDGGVKVYEKVRLSLTDYEALTKYVVKAKSQEDYYGPDYRYVQAIDYLSGKDARTDRGEGQLARVRQEIYRKADGHLLGQSISYSRAGGDFFTFGIMPSSNSCPKPGIGLQSSVFIKGE